MKRAGLVLLFGLGSRVALLASGLLGQWSLTLPTGEAGWLKVRERDGRAVVELLWAVGSARPVADFEIQGDTLSFTRNLRRPLAPKDEPARKVRVFMRADGDVLRCLLQPPGTDAVEMFTGKRQPPIPPRPDLTRVKFGPEVRLFNGQDLTGWRISNPAKKNGWSARDGLLCNDTPKTDFGAYGEFANLRTDSEFEDFQLRLEYRLPAGIGGNSGIYLRGLYEVQVTHRDSRMQGISGPGAVFGRITPTTNAGKAAGEWESLEVTLVDRHVSVRFNGTLVIDNQPVAGCTGGALQADVTAPGPLYLQGDHTSVQYRNLRLRPVVR